jgi:hypothetical protein
MNKDLNILEYKYKMYLDFGYTFTCLLELKDKIYQFFLLIT